MQSWFNQVKLGTAPASPGSRLDSGTGCSFPQNRTPDIAPGTAWREPRAAACLASSYYSYLLGSCCSACAACLLGEQLQQLLPEQVANLLAEQAATASSCSPSKQLQQLLARAEQAATIASCSRQAGSYNNCLRAPSRRKKLPSRQQAAWQADRQADCQAGRILLSKQTQKLLAEQAEACLARSCGICSPRSHQAGTRQGTRVPGVFFFRRNMTPGTAPGTAWRVRSGCDGYPTTSAGYLATGTLGPSLGETILEG
ncbi:hypothetical protein PCANC_15624 [Puccinia coronata f. sp. avenae]|uniref:Uncharacterized protein n=1 Tax=Puccinia coronata f. sp. avenae TaxID=200324 RepID=A0A2N5SF87_9BASI|nr:hypothetical protein PCANC_15624 [Puccinia coronata f. sp. avenae]